MTDVDLVNIEARLSAIAPLHQPHSVIGQFLHEDMPRLIALIRELEEAIDERNQNGLERGER